MHTVFIALDSLLYHLGPPVRLPREVSSHRYQTRRPMLLQQEEMDCGAAARSGFPHLPSVRNFQPCQRFDNNKEQTTSTPSNTSPVRKTEAAVAVLKKEASVAILHNGVPLEENQTRLMESQRSIYLYLSLMIQRTGPFVVCRISSYMLFSSISVLQKVAFYLYPFSFRNMLYCIPLSCPYFLDDVASFFVLFFLYSSRNIPYCIFAFLKMRNYPHIFAIYTFVCLRIVRTRLALLLYSNIDPYV
eukprot:g64893.t1